VCLHFSACLCGTPTDWNVGHQLHHANVGNTNQDDYDWAETVFHTAAGYMRLPKWKRTLWKVARFPPTFFLMAPALTWYVKMRLPFELRPGRKGNYRFIDKASSTAAMFCRYYIASCFQIMPLAIAGDYFGMAVGVLLFHLQHVYNPGYVRGKDEKWNLRDASMIGSSVLTIPECLKWLTFGIEYHHIHHFRTRIPGYKLRACFDGAPSGFWADATLLTPADMWDAIWMTIYDERSCSFSTFSEVEEAWVDPAGGKPAAKVE